MRVVLFDFDGTLADSYPAITASVNHVRARHGLPPLSAEEVRPHVGRGPDHLLTMTVPGADPKIEWGHYRAHHPSVLRSGTQLLPGARETLAALRDRQILAGVCSNKPRIFTAELLEFLGLAPFISVVIGPEDVPRAKPEPDMLNAALSRLDVRPEHALYVGDMVVDIQTARAAGMKVWIVPTGSDKRTVLHAAQPDRFLESLTELADLVLLGELD